VRHPNDGSEPEPETKHPKGSSTAVPFSYAVDLKMMSGRTSILGYVVSPKAKTPPSAPTSQCPPLRPWPEHPSIGLTSSYDVATPSWAASRSENTPPARPARSYPPLPGVAAMASNGVVSPELNSAPRSIRHGAGRLPSPEEDRLLERGVVRHLHTDTRQRAQRRGQFGPLDQPSDLARDFLILRSTRRSRGPRSWLRQR